MPESHRLIVDRYEGDLAVVEVDGRGAIDVPRWLLPAGARPDDVLTLTVERDAERVTATVVRDPAATARAREAARAAVDRLRRRDPGGDVTL
jgi:hypothetical protein